MNGEFWQLPGRKGILAASRQEGYAKKGVRRGPGVPGGSPGQPKSSQIAPGTLPRLEKAVPRGHRRPKNGEIPGKLAKLAGDRRKSAEKSAQSETSLMELKFRRKNRRSTRPGRWSTDGAGEGKEGEPFRDRTRDCCYLESRQVPCRVRRIEIASRTAAP